MKSKVYPLPRMPLRRKDSGVALVISLVLLLVMTILGLAGVRMISSEERMVAQTFDRTLAFQAAEATLRDSEILLEAGQPEPAALTGCTSSIVSGKTLKVCGAPDANATPRWLDATFTDWTPGSTIGTGALAITPEHFVEYLGNTFTCGFDPVHDSTACKRYRVTVRANPGGGRAAVIIQSVYATSS
jgi:type IV pilus assembly protein PilX